MDNQRNFILAAVLSLAVVFFWQMLVISPRIEAERAAAEAQAALGAQAQKIGEQEAQAHAGGQAAEHRGEAGALELPAQQVHLRVAVRKPAATSRVDNHPYLYDSLNDHAPN